MDVEASRCGVTKRVQSRRWRNVRRTFVISIATLIFVSACDVGSESLSSTLDAPVSDTPPVPGRANAPRFCTDLAESAAVRSLGDVIPRVVSGTSSATQDAQVRQAAARLRELAQGTLPGGLPARLGSAADSLDDLIGRPSPSREDALRVSAAFSALDEEVQAACEFPVG